MDYSVYKDHKHTVAYGTILNSCSYNTFFLSQEIFIWYFNWEWHMLEPEGSPLIAISSISLQAVTLSMGHTHDHIILSSIKFYKISIRVRIFFRLLIFSALLLMANQGGNQTPKVSSMQQKTALVLYRTKISQNQNHGPLRNISSYCWE